MDHGLDGGSICRLAGQSSALIKRIGVRKENVLGLQKEIIMKLTRIHQFSAAATIFAFAAITVFAQSPGSLDTTFGSGGKVILQVHNSIPTWPDGMAVQADGKIVAIVGAFTNGEKLIRLNSDGSFDTSFGNGGIVAFTWAFTSGSTTYYGNAYSVALQNIGGQERMVVAGAGHVLSSRKVVSALRLTRFMPDGSIDTTFGTNGNTVINTGYALTMSLQPDGKILTVGDLGKLVRLNANGTLDTTFGSGGVVNSGYGRAIAVDSSGGILVGGYTTIGKGNGARQAMSVKRYNSSGAVDTGFGTSGTATADFGAGTSSSIWNLVIDTTLGNTIVAGGTVGSSGFGIARFTSNGLADTSFGGTGRVSGSGASGRGLVMQPDGKILVTGQSNSDFGLVRFNYDGSLDTGFGNGGSVVTDVYGADYSNVSVLQIDPICSCPKIVMSGGATPITTFARYIVQ